MATLKDAIVVDDSGAELTTVDLEDHAVKPEIDYW